MSGFISAWPEISAPTIIETMKQISDQITFINIGTTLCPAETIETWRDNNRSTLAHKRRFYYQKKSLLLLKKEREECDNGKHWSCHFLSTPAGQGDRYAWPCPGRCDPSRDRTTCCPYLDISEPEIMPIFGESSLLEMWPYLGNKMEVTWQAIVWQCQTEDPW